MQSPAVCYQRGMDIEGWLLVGFLLINYGSVFAALLWGLGADVAPVRREWRDRGEMTADGVPYVRGAGQP